MHGHIVFKSSIRIEWYAFWPWGHVKVTWPEVSFDPRRSSYTHSYAYQREDLDGAVNFALAWSVQTLLAKKLLCSQVPPFWLFDHVTSFLTWSKNDLSKNCRSRPTVSNAVYRLSLTCYVFKISGGRAVIRPPPVGTNLAQTPVGARVKLQFSWNCQNKGPF